MNSDSLSAADCLAHIVYISVGSNMGDRLANCRRGIALLTEAGRQIRLLEQAPFYETEPVDYTDQGWFLNSVIKIATGLSPADLLERMQSVQRQLGRKADAIRFGPRLLDLDVIFYDDLITASNRLEIPHPRMHKRRFVLQPICDIDPTVVHPVTGRSVAQMLAGLDTDGQEMKRYPCDC